MPEFLPVALIEFDPSWTNAVPDHMVEAEARRRGIE